MKAIMYHYVRNGSKELPYFRYLDFGEFCRQLDYFSREYNLIAQDQFMEMFEKRKVMPGSVILTFDDGFVDHYEYVFPELIRRKLWGIFYVPTSIYNSARILDVHRIHLLLGMHGGATMLGALKGMITEEMLLDKNIREFRELTYHTQENEDATTLFKRILNYFISYEFRESIIDRLVREYFDEKSVGERVYMALDHLEEMKQAGMIIGSHGVNHLVYSKLTEEEQKKDIKASFDFLEEAIGPLYPKTFCYPYSIHSCTPEAEKILAEEGCLFSFSLENRDITLNDWLNRPHALPRHACHLLPHGKSNVGCRTRAAE